MSLIIADENTRITLDILHIINNVQQTQASINKLG